MSVNDAQFTGESFDIALGTSATWDLSTNPRVLLDITPKTAVLDGFSLIAYNVTINDGETNKTSFSGIFTTGGESLPLELVSGLGNETRSYGPDFSTAGTYHVQSAFKNGSSYQVLK